MFTGLVQAVGRVLTVCGPAAAGAGGTARLELEPGGWGHEPEAGDSVCVNGVCLTVAGTGGGIAGRRWTFDVVRETLERTALGGLAAGARVNLEHSVTPTTLMGGHFVQGHVDGVGVVERVEKVGEWRVRLGLGAELMKWMVPKGSVCLDGVSLTLAGLGHGHGGGGSGWIEVALIPTTLERTTLGGWCAGTRVNVEGDVIVKAVVHTVEMAKWPNGQMAT